VVKALFQANVVRSLLKGLDPIHRKSVTLIPGQIFNGKIIKLYPGQLASLRLGGLALTAKLEAALTVGDRYWFQVQRGEGLPVLKVFEALPQNGKYNGNDSENILRKLGLSNLKQSDLLVNYLAKEGLPFTRGHVHAGVQTLQSVGMTNEQGLEILKLLIERNLPITPLTFSAIHSVVSGQGLANQLQDLSLLLQQHQGKDPDIQQIQHIIRDLLNEGNVKVDRHQLLEMIKVFLTDDSRTTQFTVAETELRKLGVINKQSPQQLLAHFNAEVAKASVVQLKQIWPTLIKEQVSLELSRGQIGELLSKVVLEKGENGERTLQQLLSLFSGKTEKSSEGFSFSLQEESLAKQLTSIINRIGYQHERDVQQLTLHRNESNETLLLQLKASLLKSQQLQLPLIIQERVESILNLITGQQILSVNQESPFVNQVVMLPLKLMGENTDLTIQWEGKKDKDGKLNPDHCRVLFYLNLNKLKETIIDVQIQSRIVSLHIYNEQEKPIELIAVLQPYLKQALKELNYQLTSVKWTQSSQSTKSIEKQTGVHSLNTHYQTQRHYQGVDIRI
jgi:hypothetical protein